jgi:ubiquinol-cytochrome c reductase cytochrome b subunit
MIFSAILFFSPALNGYFLEHANFVEANPLKTPDHIAPVWYFTPFYAVLRAVPDKFLGVVAMAGAIIVLFLLPWLDRGVNKSIRYRGPVFKAAIVAFVISFVGLGYFGMQPVSPVGTFFSRLFSIVYFAFFLLMPWYSNLMQDKYVPERVEEK